MKMSGQMETMRVQVISRCRRKPWLYACVAGLNLACLGMLLTYIGPESVAYFRPRYYLSDGAASAPTSPPAPPSAALHPPPRQLVVLVTYGRSGSSFTSALVGAHPDVFYMFEPIFPLDHLQHLTETNGALSMKLFNRTREMLESVLTCNFTDPKVLQNMHMTKSEDTARTYYCLHAPKKTVWAHLSCLFKMVRNCQSKFVHFAKTIRFRLKWAEWFLENHPNFKVMYLIRDPRAVLYSQARVFRSFDWPTAVKNKSKSHCGRMKDDVTHFLRLRDLYPNRVKAVRYEDGATEPLAYASAIYDFIGLNMTRSTQDYIRNITNSGKIKKEQEKYDFSVNRENSTYTMNRWRYYAGFTTVRVVDRVCLNLYSKLGYSRVLSQKDLESDRQLVVEPEQGGLY